MSPQWLMADDRMHILSYLNCCDALGLDPERGRAWARATLAGLGELLTR